VAGRYPEIDALKAIGALTIVLIHCLRPPGDPTSTALELVLGEVTRFAVPAFLFSSGFLYCSSAPLPRGTTIRRLRRLLGPYVVASLLAQLFWALRGQPRTGVEIALQLLFGASFGPFYYVFLVAMLIPFVPLLPRIRRGAWPAAAAVAVGVQMLSPALLAALAAAGWQPGADLFARITRAAGVGPLFWLYRFPLLWWPFFLVGWVARLYDDPLRSMAVRWRGLLAGMSLTLAAVFVALALGGTGIAPLTAGFLHSYALTAAIFFTFGGLAGESPTLRFISDASFTIYLFHLFFVLSSAPYFHAMTGWRAPLAVLGPWGCGMVGSLVVGVAGRWIFGARSRDIVGM
jgi:peptidoglycan/LPS O-acetylase OafA/YrhL